MGRWSSGLSHFSNVNICVGCSIDSLNIQACGVKPVMGNKKVECIYLVYVLRFMPLNLVDLCLNWCCNFSPLSLDLIHEALPCVVFLSRKCKIIIFSNISPSTESARLAPWVSLVIKRMIDFVLTGWWQSRLIPFSHQPKDPHMSFHSRSSTVSTLPPFCSQRNIACVFWCGCGGGGRWWRGRGGVPEWCCVKMRKGAPWLNLTLLCDLCGISASGRGGVGKKEGERERKDGDRMDKGALRCKKKKERKLM